MRVAEIYKSIQGEGRLTGVESVFVRASGCNLRCWFCDTPWASWAPEGDDLGIDDIVQQVVDFDCRHVVITGGEPMLFAELIPLCRQLREQGRHVTIETAGTLDLPVECDLMSISPKLANSSPPANTANQWRRRHEQTRHAPQVIRRLIGDYDYQLKFVIDRQDDCAEVLEYLQLFPEIDRQQVWLMPQGVKQEELERTTAWLAEYCTTHDLRLCPRKHLEWFGAVRGV